MGEVVPFPISDIRLAQLCGLSYVQPATFETSDAHVAVTLENGYLVIALRGSKSIIDWIRDLMIAPALTAAHPELGICHSGFLFDVLDIATSLTSYLKGSTAPFVICGHSKGGAEAQLLAGLLVTSGFIPARLVTFGAPRCAWIGNTTLPKLISGIPGNDYRGGSDEVPQLPLPYVHPRQAALKQLGDQRFVLDWIPFHLLTSYEKLLTA